MRVLVTGANGFVGSALCSHLSKLGHHVVAAVRRRSGIMDEYIFEDETSWQSSLTGCDSVVHLAGRIDPIQGHEDEVLHYFRAVNLKATINMAYRAAKAGVRRFVFISTIKVNGEETAPGFSFNPEDFPAPQGPYAISKWEAEQALSMIAEETGLEVVIIRPPLIYGPGVKGNFASLIQLAKMGLPLPFGAIKNRRSMIALDNLVSFIALCADINASPNAKNQVFLICDGEDVSTTELLRKVAEAYDYNIRLFSMPVGLMRYVAKVMGKATLSNRLFGSLVINDSKARKTLGWHPIVNMEEQLKQMALYDSRF
jgi:nucleoside-diphosphate-sugar epimerase